MKHISVQCMADHADSQDLFIGIVKIQVNAHENIIIEILILLEVLFLSKARYDLEYFLAISKFSLLCRTRRERRAMRRSPW